MRGLDNAAYYRLLADESAPLRQRHRHRQHRQFLAPARDPADAGFAALLGAGISRRRLPLRSERDAGARAAAASIRGSGFFDALMQDPTLARVKLIAEPWDLGPGGYQLGNHPPGMAEWNDKFRDDVRRFWRGDSGLRGALAARLQGSADLFDHHGRRPWAVAQLHHRARRLHAAGLGQLQPASTTRPTARTIATAPTTTPATTGAWRARPMMRRSRRRASASSARCWRRCCSRTARRCCSAAMSSAAPSTATTMPTARTTSCPGSTGRRRSRPRASSSSAFVARLIQLRREFCTPAQRATSSTAARAAAAGARHRMVRRERRHHARRGLAVHRRHACCACGARRASTTDAWRSACC